MDRLKVSLKNCYGIQSLDHEFDFTSGNARPKPKVVAIYAPNGLMKTSFSRTFENIAKGENPKEERYNRPSKYVVESDGLEISKDSIYVLKSEIDISSDSQAITNILVNPENKVRYDELMLGLDSIKKKLIKSLQKSSKLKQADVERIILEDWAETDFSACIEKIKRASIEDNLQPYEYATIFDPKAIAIFRSPEFVSKAAQFNARYQELFDLSGTIYQKGVFNPAKAEASFSTLDKQGFFSGGHRVHLKGDSVSIDKDMLDEKLRSIHASIDGDADLRALRSNLAKNAQTQALTDLFESLSSTEIEFLLEKLKPENQSQFSKDLWTFYIQNNPDVDEYLAVYRANKAEIEAIESEAAESAPRWSLAVDLFNDRFVDMPFRLSVANQALAVLGKENAKLKFRFEDGDDSVEWSRQEIKTLSQGEKRALYLLNFIFEVESRKLANQDTIFIIDDVADSFDYKNKHAIVLYLNDLSGVDFFHQIILTHNFDFFRTLANTFVPYDRCFMTNRSEATISLIKAEGVKNYFIGKWKDNVTTNNHILCATIPFTRNLIEYTKGEDNPDYLKLTSLLHWKSDTNSITVGDYLDIYNRLFGSSYAINKNTIVKDLLLDEAAVICNSKSHTGLNLENKVLLSIAIRMRAEIFLTGRLRVLKSDPEFWCPSINQFGKLMKEFASLDPDSPAMRVLEKVSITVSSHIHLNSFMYEPILDLTIEHLIDLYNEVSEL